MSQHSSIWFDLETTGMGYGPKMFDNPVSIWQLSYNANGNVGNMYANVYIPFEAGALRHGKLGSHGGLENKAPLAYTQAAGKISEQEMITNFAKVIKANPDAVLSGHNIRGYDIPLLAKKLEQYGLHEELKILKNMRTNDTLVNFRNFLHKKLDPAFKGAMGVSEEKYLTTGTSLHVAARAFGIDTSKYTAHEGASDVELSQELDKILSGPEADKRYSLNAHIEAHDALKKKGDISWARVQDRALQTNPNLVRTVDTMEPPELVRVGDIIGDTIVPTAKSVKQTMRPVGAQAAEAIDRMANTIGKGFTEATKKSKQIFGKKTFSALAVFAVADALMLPVLNKIRKHHGHDDRDQYISPHALGAPEDYIASTIKKTKNIGEFNNALNSFSKSTSESVGTKIGKDIAEDFKQKGFSYGSEVEVFDDELHIRGMIDILGDLNGEKIPIEVKSTSEEHFNSLSEPEYEHASQANFYAHATGASGSYVFYVSQDNPEHKKAFYVPYSPERLIRDVANFRSILLSTPGQNSGLAGWNTFLQTDDFLANSAMPNQVIVDPNMTTGTSKIRDQHTKNSHLFPMGRRNYGNNTRNASRYDRRS